MKNSKRWDLLILSRWMDYISNQLLKLPEKNLKIGDETITKDNCGKYYPPQVLLKKK